ncbi:Variant-specific surface protein, partial [Giardia duodenalis]
VRFWAAPQARGPAAQHTHANTCTECLAGYYKTSANKCVKCDKDDSNITGVPNCVSCAPPASSGIVTCYVTQTPAVDPADPSVNKGGLSSGAIAGISVAVIAVVGGLVGFLCWWFICRGKA